MVLQGALDLGEVDSDAVDLALYPATYLRDLSHIRAESSLPLSESSNVGAHKLKRLRKRSRSEQANVNLIAKLRELAAQRLYERE